MNCSADELSDSVAKMSLFSYTLAHEVLTGGLYLARLLIEYLLILYNVTGGTMA